MLTKNDFKQAILEIIEDSKYKEKITEIGEYRPMTGLEKDVWWREYVIRNCRAKYLKNAVADFSWYKFLLLDVLTFFVAIAILSLFILYKALNIGNNARELLLITQIKRRLFSIIA